SLAAEQLGGVFLQTVNRWIFAIDIISDLSLGYGATHGRRWAGNGVAAQVNNGIHKSRPRKDPSPPASPYPLPPRERACTHTCCNPERYKKIIRPFPKSKTLETLRSKPDKPAR